MMDSFEKHKALAARLVIESNLIQDVLAKKRAQTLDRFADSEPALIESLRLYQSDRRCLLELESDCQLLANQLKEEGN